MSNKNRWPGILLANLLIFFTAYFYDIKPGYSRITMLKLKQAQLCGVLASRKERLLEKQKHDFNNMAESASQSDMELLSYVTGLAGKSSVRLVSYAFKKTSLNFIFEGDYSWAANFMEELLRSFNVEDIQHLSYKKNKKLELNLNLAAFPVLSSSKGKISIKLKNHFCSKGQTFTVPEDQKHTFKFFYSVNDLKMAGYLHAENYHLALVALPDETVVDVSVGSLLGKERGKVTEINENDITILLPGGAIYRIRK